jgi:hypothetical protein
LILIFSVNTNHESVAYRSFSPSEFEARGARKVNCDSFEKQAQSVLLVNITLPVVRSSICKIVKLLESP